LSAIIGATLVYRSVGLGGRKTLPPNLRRREIIHDVAEIEGA